MLTVSAIFPATQAGQRQQSALDFSFPPPNRRFQCLNSRRNTCMKHSICQVEVLPSARYILENDASRVYRTVVNRSKDTLQSAICLKADFVIMGALSAYRFFHSTAPSDDCHAVAATHLGPVMILRCSASGNQVRVEQRNIMYIRTNAWVSSTE